jgi:hypothetical protein
MRCFAFFERWIAGASADDPFMTIFLPDIDCTGHRLAPGRHLT